MNVALEIAQDGPIKGLGAQLPYQQGVAEAILAGYALLGKQAPSYVAVPSLKVMKENVIDAWQLVYHEDAPDIIQSVAKSRNAREKGNNKMKVLIADDDVTSRKLLRYFIESLSKYKIVGEAANGEELIHYVTKRKTGSLL